MTREVLSQMKKHVLVLIFSLSSATLLAQSEFALKTGLVFPYQRYRFESPDFIIKKYPKLTPVACFGFRYVKDNSKKVTVVLDGEYRSGDAKGLEYNLNPGIASTVADLKYNLISFGISTQISVLPNKRLFVSGGISYYSSFLKLTQKTITNLPPGATYIDIFDLKSDRNSRGGITAGIGYRCRRFATEAKLRIINYDWYSNTPPFFIDHSSFAINLSVPVLNEKSDRYGKNDSLQVRRKNSILYGFRIGWYNQYIEPLKYNSSLTRIDSSTTVAKGPEMSFLAVPKLTSKISLVMELGMRYATYHTYQRVGALFSSIGYTGYNFRHYIWNINANCMVRVGVDKKNAFYFQGGLGTCDQYRYEGKGEKQMWGAWGYDGYDFKTNDLTYFPLGISRRNAIFGFGFQCIEIGNRRMFAEMRASVPFTHSGILFKERDNVITTMSVGYFFNKFNN